MKILLRLFIPGGLMRNIVGRRNSRRYLVHVSSLVVIGTCVSFAATGCQSSHNAPASPPASAITSESSQSPSLILSPSPTAPPATTAPNALDPSSPVSIPNKFLLNCVDETLQLKSGTQITVSQAQSVKDLQCGPNGEISDVTGLQAFTSLTSLGLSEAPITDISPLSDLKNLTSLDISGSRMSEGSDPLSDISPLAGLTNLTSLDLTHDSVVDISPLSGLTNLTDLSLGINKIRDVSPLASLVKLTHLDLEDNQINNLSPLSKLPVVAKVGNGQTYWYSATGQNLTTSQVSVNVASPIPITNANGAKVKVTVTGPGNATVNMTTGTITYPVPGTYTVKWSVTNISDPANADLSQAGIFDGSLSQPVAAG